MMTTPVVQFIDQYRHSGTLRLHMPGHKGQGEMEALDITEIQGADPLYPAAGILREGEENAALLFGAGRTLYSAEGSSLCIRAMLYLARLRAEQNQIPPRILAGRNAHRTFLAGAAVLGLEVAWIPGENLLTCLPSTQELRQALAALPQPPAAVYLTSPDYLGHRADIASLAAVCHAQGVPLLVDNAHGAYLRFLPQDQHPLSLGADLVCDSGHKTLPVLTGGAYLHIHREAEPLFFQQAERALALFASTSPSWLILRSLDACNGYLAGDYPQELARFSAQVDKVKDAMQAHGYALIGEEPLKITIAPKSFGYTGDQLHDCLRGADMECEFSDPDFLVMMVTPQTGLSGLERLQRVLTQLPRRDAILQAPPALPPSCPAVPLARALLAPAEEVPVAKSLGRILADPCVSCPPAVPILVSGERITEDAIRCFEYYGVSTVLCMME